MHANVRREWMPKNDLESCLNQQKNAGGGSIACCSKNIL